ncbi:MAG: hypothetical protein P8N00_05525, partial [Flavobacteriales bacterium]|nr:hypothetical protein [Flavobacteriales bacterium]
MRSFVFIGNMNNNFNVLLSYARTIDIEARLLYFSDTPQHFLPSSDSFSMFIDFTFNLGYSEMECFENPTHLTRHIDRNDILIGCGLVPAILQKVDLKLDLFIPYGSDIYQVPFKVSKNPFKLKKSLNLMKFQKEGIRGSMEIWIGESSPFWKSVCMRLGVEYSLIRYPMLFVDYNSLAMIQPNTNIRILHPIRHYWKTTSDKVAKKGN